MLKLVYKYTFAQSLKFCTLFNAQELFDISDEYIHNIRIYTTRYIYFLTNKIRNYKIHHVWLIQVFIAVVKQLYCLILYFCNKPLH